MRLDKWAVTAQEALQAALGIAADADAGQVQPVHLLKALLSSGERNIGAIVERVGVDPTSIESQVDDAIARQPKVSGGMMRQVARLARTTSRSSRMTWSSPEGMDTVGGHPL